jgi:DNA-binding NarL/FixJ family response regulator
LPIPEQAQQVDAVRGPDREIRVLVVDDHKGFREVLADLIAASPGFVLAGTACSGQEAVDAVEDLAPELVLMDVMMPGMDGIAATRAILRSSPKVVVVLTSVDAPELYRGVNAFGNDVGWARKQDLRPQRLQEMWNSHHG